MGRDSAVTKQSTKHQVQKKSFQISAFLLPGGHACSYLIFLTYISQKLHPLVARIGQFELCSNKGQSKALRTTKPFA